MMRISTSLLIGMVAIFTVVAFPAFSDTIIVDGSDTTADKKGGNLVCGLVSGDRPNNACDTIQNGVDRANPGDTVQVRPGSYPEQVVIDKPLTLAGGGGSVNANALGPGGQVVGQATGRPVINPNLGTLGKLTVDLDGDGNDDIDSENRQPIIWVHDADNVKINGFVIRDSSPSSNLPDAPRGVYVTVDSNTNNGSSDNFTFKNNNVEDLVSGSNRARGLILNVQETATTSNEESPDVSEDTAKNPSITNNTFQNIKGTGGQGTDRALGIVLNGDIQNANITNNTITDLSSSSTQVKAISLTEDKASPAVGPTGFTIEGNKIDNLVDKRAKKQQESALFVGGYKTLGDNDVHRNNFLDGAVDRCCGGLNLDVLNATNNWWGDASGPSTSDDQGHFPGKLSANEYAQDTDSNSQADGNGAPIVKRKQKPANVNYYPFLENKPIELVSGNSVGSSQPTLGPWNLFGLLRMIAGGQPSADAAEPEHPTVEPLSMATVQMSRLGANYTLTVRGQGITATQVQVYDLTGKRVVSDSANGNTLRFRPLTETGQPLANGVYLYQVTVRGQDGDVVRSDVRKFVVMR